MKILVTGSAGFIGFSLARRLLEDGHEIIGLDNFNDYYDVNLKLARQEILEGYKGYRVYRINLEDDDAVRKLFQAENPQRVVHLAAQAGVRYSLEHPEKYIQSNVVGFMNILECCRHFKVEHLAYASSSSVYGLNTNFPFSVHHNVDHPVSLYAATKKGNELMAHCYSHLFNLPTTGLRFFTVYGPWGRPDMALFIFANNIIRGLPIDVYNQGDMVRDFTYIDDIVEGVVRVTMQLPQPNSDWDGQDPDPGTSPAPYRIYNIGCNTPVNLMDFVREIEKNLGKEATINFLPIQPGDVRKTHADVDDLIRDLDYKPKIDIQTGVKNFVEWFVEYWENREAKSKTA